MQRISITNPQNIIDGTAKKYYFKLRNTGGPKGDKGDKGDTGSQGPQGPQGDPCTVVVNSTATLEPGSNAYVTNTGSLSNAVLDFGIPKGDRGPQGPKGDKGDTGAKGETGPRGPQGEKGTNATVYVGTTSTLAPGSQATVYNSGSDSNAVLNFGIPKGEKGDTGSQGPQGPQGPTGPAGQNFAPTIVAELPATGDSSKLYLTPKAHTTSTATGNPITATVTEEAGQMESFQLDGDTFQQSYTGKNLLSLNHLILGKNNNGEFSIDDTEAARWRTLSPDYTVTPIPSGTQLTMSVRETSGTAKGIGYFVRLIASDNSYQDFPVYIPSNSTTGYNAGTITTTFEVVKFRMVLDAYTTETMAVNLSVQWQLEEGSTATSFEPYVGGQPSPSPDYPQPIQTVTGEQTVTVIGKNLFRAKDGQYRTSTLAVDVENGVIHVYGRNHASYDQNVWIPVEDIHADGTYTLTMNYSGYGGGAFRLNKDKSYQAADNFGGTYYSPNRGTPVTASATNITYNWILIHLSHGSSLSEVDYYINPQFESGSSSTDFEPHQSQTYPLNLGKNLWPDTYYKDGYVISAGGVDTPLAAGAIWATKAKPSTAYSFSLVAHGTGNLRFHAYDKSGNWIKQIAVFAISTLNTRVSGSITTPANCAELRWGFLKDIADPQLELGSTATDYAEYFEPIELCKIGDYQDYFHKDNGTWYKTAQIGKAVVSSFSAQKNSGVSGEYIFTLSLDNALKTASEEMSQARIDKLRATTRQYVYGNPSSNTFAFPSEGSDYWGTGGVTAIDEIKTMTLAEANTWLASNPLTIYYALATPTDTTITNQALIDQLEAIRTASLQNGTNTITNSATVPNLAGDMEVGYYGYNPTNRYDKWIWLDFDNSYEQLNNPESTAALSSTRSLNTTTEQTTPTRSIETVTLKKGGAEPIEDKTESPTILNDKTEETEETETTEPEESDGTDER